MRVRLRHDVLQRLLALSRLSQNHWALKLGFSRGHWSDLVNGRHPYPSPKTRQRLMDVLEVPFETLFTIEQGPTAWAEIDFRAAIADRYLTEQELGQGGMGSVYVARDLARGRLVALKVISPEAVSGIGTTAFMREISFLAQLNHPHILPLFDSGVVAEHPFHVMPWMREGSLRDLLRRRVRLSLGEVRPIVRGIAAALDHAHAQRILHCDVKPENVLLHGAHAYVMDFGIARALHAEVSDWRARNELDLSAGTPAYVSPEQARGDADLDARADVYSLACVVHELLTGRAPFEGKDTLATVSRRFEGPAPSVREHAPDVPRATAEWIRQAMSLDREQRPPTAFAFAEGLDTTTRPATLMTPILVGASRAVGRLRQPAARPPHRPTRPGLAWLRGEVAQAARALARAPRFALAVVVPLALALGAGSALLDLVDRLLFQPPPGVRAPDGIVRFAVRGRQSIPPFATFTRSGLTGLDLEALGTASQTFPQVAAYVPYTPSLGRGADARFTLATIASASYFPLLGVTPARGRFWTEDEDDVGATSVPCVASDGFWRTMLGSSPTLGQTLLVGRLQCTIVGVTPEGFRGLDLNPTELWIPLRAGGADMQGNDPLLWTTDRSAWLRIVGRMAPGTSRELAAAAANRAYRSRPDRQRDPKLEAEMIVEPLIAARGSQPQPGVRTAVWLAGGAGLLLMLIAANLVNLFVARQLARLRETAIRLALGGSRLALFRHHAIEVGLLSLAAGALALLVGRWIGPAARGILMPSVIWEGTAALDVRAALVTTLVSLVIGLAVSGLVALHTARVDPVQLLRSGGSPQVAGVGRTRRLRLALVGVQAALSMALVVVSAGFVRSFRAASATDLGFAVDRVLVALVPLHSAGYTRAQQWTFYENARDQLRAVPGVVGASLGYMVPWNNNRNEDVSIPGRDSLPPFPGFGAPAFDAVTPDYLQTMGMRLVAGRFVSEQDRAGSAPVIVVTQTLARHYWPGEASVLGRCIRVGADSLPCREIVGVIADYRFTGPLDSPIYPSYFLPLDQARGYNFVPYLFLRVQGDAEAMAGTLRRTFQAIAPELPATEVRPLANRLEPLLAPWRLGAIAFTALGVLAAIIAVLGLAGVLAFLVNERRRDFAVRSALGASRGQIARPVLRQAVLVVGMGLLAGTLAVRLVTPWVEPLLFRVRLLDPATLAVLAALLLASALLAALAPARRAARSDPMEVLRAQ